MKILESWTTSNRSFSLASNSESSSMSRVTSTSYSLSLSSPTTSSITSVLACEMGFWARWARFRLCSRLGLSIGPAFDVCFLARWDSGQGCRVFYNAEQGEKSSVLVSFFIFINPGVLKIYIIHDQFRSFGRIVEYKYRKV